MVFPSRAGRRIPNSYLMELITIHLWEQHGRNRIFNTLKAFRGVMEALRGYESLNAVWRKYYSEPMISNQGYGIDRDENI